jgi:Concanavalin A-like lectin/glucanases superfamily
MTQDKSQFKAYLSAIFVISTLSFVLQFLETRMLSVVYWQHIVYFVVTLSLLGFAVSGTLMSVFKGLGELPKGKFLAFCFAGFSLSSILCVILMTYVSGKYFEFSTVTFNFDNLLRLILSYFLAMIPFVFFGLVVLNAFKAFPDQSSEIYFVNLLGSALGCFLYIALITPMGVTGMLIFVVFCPTAALFFHHARELSFESRTTYGIFATLVFALAFTLRLDPDQNKQFWTMISESQKVLEFSEWNPISRIDVISDRESGVKRILIDGDAQAPLLPEWEGLISSSEAAWNFSGENKGTLRSLQGKNTVTINQIALQKEAGHGDIALFDSAESRLDSDIDLDPKKPFGFSVILKPTTVNGSGVRSIFNLSSQERSWGELTTRSDQKNRYDLLAGTKKASFSLTPNVWTTLYVNWDPDSNNLDVYVNKTPLRMWVPTLPKSGTLHLSFGKQVGKSSFSGAIDNLVVWDRNLSFIEVCALSQELDNFYRQIPYLSAQARTQANPDKVLVIGVGGGADVLAAHKFHAKDITAVEINPTTYHLLNDEYASYVGHLYQRENVHLNLEDGRSFVRRSKTKFDSIVMVGVDSLAALSSGAYVNMESYLYTTEAIADYWNHLSERGQWYVARWYEPQAPRETLRLFVMAYDTLKRLGVSDPSRHLMVISNLRAETLVDPFAGMIMTKEPLSESAFQVLSRNLAANQFGFVFAPYPVAGGYIEGSKAFFEYVASTATNSSAFFDKYQFDVSPVTDDRPFFFQYGKWNHLFHHYTTGPKYFDSIQGRWPYFVISALLLQCLLAVTFLTVVQLRKVRLTDKRGAFPTVVYFSSLGFGFMFVEMFLIQRFVLILGHPIYSMAVVLPLLLISAALGSLFSQRLNLASPRPLAAAFLALCAVILVVMAMLPYVSQALLVLPDWARMVACGLILLPLGFLMGIPFPSGIRSLGGSADLISLAWIVNGGTSVIASILAILFAMTWGFTGVGWIAVALYGIGFLSFPGRHVSASDSLYQLDRTFKVA